MGVKIELATNTIECFEISCTRNPNMGTRIIHLNIRDIYHQRPPINLELDLDWPTSELALNGVFQQLAHSIFEQLKRVTPAHKNL